MISTKRTTLKHIGITIAVGMVFAVLFLKEEKPDLPDRARDLLPEELVAGTMVTADFGKDNGAALFNIEGQIPATMQSIDVLPFYTGVRTPGRNARLVNWSSTAPMRVYAEPGYQNCSCFACISNAQICAIASEWLNKEGSLLYLSSDPRGTSYLLNRDHHQIIVAWNHPL